MQPVKKKFASESLELYFTGFYAAEAEKSLNICLKWINGSLFVFRSEPFKCQPHETVKHTQTIRWMLPTNCLSVFDHFVELALKGLNYNEK